VPPCKQLFNAAQFAHRWSQLSERPMYPTELRYLHQSHRGKVVIATD
jgi:hypothetical protein